MLDPFERRLATNWLQLDRYFQLGPRREVYLYESMVPVFQPAHVLSVVPSVCIRSRDRKHNMTGIGTGCLAMGTYHIHHIQRWNE